MTAYSQRPGDSGRPGGVGPSFGEDEGTPSDWDPRNACMTEEEEAIARRKTAELRASAAGQPPPPPCSADSAAWGGPHTMYAKYDVSILLKMDAYYNVGCI